MFTGPKRRDAIECRLEIQRPKRPEEEGHADGESRVADTRDDERLLPGVRRGLLAEIKANEQIGTEPHAFPTHKHQRVIGGRDQREHHEKKEIQIGEKAVVTTFMLHVPARIEVNQESNDRDRQRHDQGQSVVVECILRAQIAGLNPGEIAMDERLWLSGGLRICPSTEKAKNHGKARRPASNEGDGGLGKAAAPDAIQRRARERGQHHQQEQEFEVHENNRLNRATARQAKTPFGPTISLKPHLRCSAIHDCDGAR